MYTFAHKITAVSAVSHVRADKTGGLKVASTETYWFAQAGEIIDVDSIEPIDL